MSSQSAYETVFQLLETQVMNKELETGDEFRGTEMQQKRHFLLSKPFR
jgi:hypothetical protein